MSKLSRKNKSKKSDQVPEESVAIKDLLPSSFCDLFLSSNHVHQYETRPASQYRPHFCKPNIIKSNLVSFTEDLKSGNRCLFH